MTILEIARLIAPLAPVAGSILADLIPLPIPGKSAIGRKFGELIASSLGVKPEVLGTSLQEKIAQGKSAEVIAAIEAATARARTEIDGFVELERAHTAKVVASIEQTGATMRLEVLPENRHWFFTGWRPACGWTFVLYAVVFGALLSYATILALWGDDRALTVIVGAWPAYLAFFGPLGMMVGVYVFARSSDKAAGVDTSTKAVKPLPSIKRG